ncbi:MAG: RDD family protein [Bacteroidota bacterium]
MAEETKEIKTVNEQTKTLPKESVESTKTLNDTPELVEEAPQVVSLQNPDEDNVKSAETETVTTLSQVSQSHIEIDSPPAKKVVSNRKKKKATKKQSNRFKIDRLQISSDLDGVILASFTRRSFAFAIDIAVLLGIVSAWWLAIVVLVVMKLLNRDLKYTFRKVNTSISLQVRSIDQKLQNYEIEEELRAKFKKHLSIYLNVLIYLPIAVAFLLLLGIISGFFTSEDGATVLGQLVALFNSTLSPLNFLVGGVLTVLYFGIMNYFYQGKTVGKKICGIRVVRLNGKKMTFRGSIERATGYTASGSLFLYGFFQFFWDPNRQTTHDKITETIVIRD